MFDLLLKYCLFCSLLILAFSCGDYADVDCENYDYSTCVGVEPDSYDVEILITQLNDSEKIPITLYKGKYDIFGDEPQVYLTDTAVSPLYVVRLAFGYNYSVKAEYKRPSGDVYAIDGAFLSKKDKDVCDSVCLEIDGELLDARLKK